MQTESLKGRPCPNRPITCQEGWCNECELGDDECLRCGANRTALRGMIHQGDRASLGIADIITGNCPACKKAMEEYHD